MNDSNLEPSLIVLLGKYDEEKLMDIFKIIIIAFISVAMCLILKQTRPELAMLTALMTVIVIIFFTINYIGQVV